MNIQNLSSRAWHCELAPRALDKWNPAIRAAVESTENTITIYGVIGENWYGDGVTVQRIDAALRSIGDNPVTVYINSPGGDMFEGIAIYNRLREHTKTVTTKVVGLAASAASVIFMAGAERHIASSGFLMIHNCWTILAGNRHYLRRAADDMEEFDAAMTDLYSERSGVDGTDVAEMMDDETFIRGKRCVELGFATDTLASDEVTEKSDETTASANALKRMDACLAKAGMPRSERRKLYSDIKSSTQNAVGGDKQDAIPTDMPEAVHVTAKETAAIAASLKGIFPIQ
ncbi:head maturation protease, ClpP-related [Advenella mimigardefordensis]|nr:head maturation protease, ClpP-related [Advenella mimigardefordensis]